MYPNTDWLWELDKEKQLELAVQLVLASGKQAECIGCGQKLDSQLVVDIPESVSAEIS